MRGGRFHAAAEVPASSMTHSQSHRQFGAAVIAKSLVDSAHSALALGSPSLFFLESKDSKLRMTE